MFDVTNWQSFFCTTSWFQEIEKHYPDKNVVKLLIGAKSDACEREVDGLKAKVLENSDHDIEIIVYYFTK